MNRAEIVGSLYTHEKGRFSAMEDRPCLLRLTTPPRAVATGLLVHQLLHQIDILQRLKLGALFVVDAARVPAGHILKVLIGLTQFGEPRRAFASMCRMGAVIGG